MSDQTPYQQQPYQQPQYYGQPVAQQQPYQQQAYQGQPTQEQWGQQQQQQPYQEYPTEEQQAAQQEHPTEEQQAAQQEQGEQTGAEYGQRRTGPMRDRIVNLIDRLLSFIETKLDTWEQGGTTPATGGGTGTQTA